METKPAQTEATRLKWDEGGQVLIHPDTNDLFMLARREAVSACVNQAEYQSFRRMMNEKWKRFCDRVIAWCEEHPQVSRVIFSSRESEYILLVVLEGETHDFEIADAVSDFDLELREQFAEFACSVLTIPSVGASNISAFLDEAKAQEIYAKSRKPQGGG